MPSILERTPRQILEGAHITKDKPPLSEGMTFEELPLHRRYTGEPEVLGTGDYFRKTTSEGSVVIDAGSWVAKAPLGEAVDPRSVLERAREKKEIIAKHKGVTTPETQVIVARTHAGEAPQPVVLQRKVEGVPVVDMPLRELLKPAFLRKLKGFMNEYEKVWRQTDRYDLSGVRFSNETVSGFLSGLPFFSDNLMVTPEGELYLVDNAPERDHAYGKVKMLAYRVRHKMATVLVSLLAALSHG